MTTLRDQCCQTGSSILDTAEDWTDRFCLESDEDCLNLSLDQEATSETSSLHFGLSHEEKQDECSNLAEQMGGFDAIPQVRSYTCSGCYIPKKQLQIIAALISNLLPMQAGINMAYSNILIPQLSDPLADIPITKEEASWIGKKNILFLFCFKVCTIFSQFGHYIAAHWLTYSWSYNRPVWSSANRSHRHNSVSDWMDFGSHRAKSLNALHSSNSVRNWRRTVDSLHNLRKRNIRSTNTTSITVSEQCLRLSGHPADQRARNVFRMAHHLGSLRGCHLCLGHPSVVHSRIAAMVSHISAKR